MTWFTLVSYSPPITSGIGTNGGVGGGWNDVGSVWRLANFGGGASDNVIQTTSASTSPWTNAQLVRSATNENAQNVRVRFRWQIASGGTGAAPFAFIRYVPNTTDAQANGLAVKTGQLFPISAGALGSPTNGSGTITNGAWYDTEVIATTSGSTTTITETTTNVTNHIADAFASGSSVASNSYSTGNSANVSGGVGLFSYQPGTLSVQQFSTYSDTAVTALTLSPATASGSAGTAVTYTVTANGAQNGGAVALSDGGAGGSFSPASITMSAGAGAAATFTYSPGTPAAGTTVTVTASSSTLTGTLVSGSATLAVASAAATALVITPNAQNVSAGSTTGTYTVSANGSISASTVVTLAASTSGGSFSPSSLTLTASSATATFTYSVASSTAAGNITLTASTPALSATSATASVVSTATNLAISPNSQTVTVGTASSNFTVTTNGLVNGSITISLSDGSAGGTLSPATVTISSSSPSATFTYTPAAASGGGLTLMAAATGLAAATATVTPVQPNALLTPAHSSVVLSPYNWVTSLANSVTSNNTAARCWNPGAYSRVYVTGCTSLSVLFGASNTSAYFTYQVDDGVPSSAISCLSNNSYAITLPDSGAHTLTWTLFSLPQSTGRWSGTNAVTLNGFQPGSGGTAAAATRGARQLLIYGDSIAEGIQSRDGSDGATTGFAYYLGEAFRRQGWEYGIKAAGASGYSVQVASNQGGQPPAWTSGNDASSSWNKIDGSGAPNAALTNGSIGGASERFVTLPDLIVDTWGTNDGLQSASDTTVQTIVTGLLQRLRVAAPNTVVVEVVPFGGYKRASVRAAVAALGDARTVLVDLKTDGRMTAAAYCGNLLSGAAGSQNIHPWSLGSAILGNNLVSLVQAAYVPFATARAFGGVS